eukprot:scaffold65757_cov21-Tisochrysis_lutea.AAC.2
MHCSAVLQNKRLQQVRLPCVGPTVCPAGIHHFAFLSASLDHGGMLNRFYTVFHNTWHPPMILHCALYCSAVLQRNRPGWHQGCMQAGAGDSRHCAQSHPAGHHHWCVWAFSTAAGALELCVCVFLLYSNALYSDQSQNWLIGSKWKFASTGVLFMSQAHALQICVFWVSPHKIKQVVLCAALRFTECMLTLLCVLPDEIKE